MSRVIGHHIVAFRCEYIPPTFIPWGAFFLAKIGSMNHNANACTAERIPFMQDTPTSNKLTQETHNQYLISCDNTMYLHFR